VSVRTIHIDDPDYPRGLRDLADPPESLSVQGNFSPAALRVAIVGARAADPRFVPLAKRLAAAVAARGGVVVSGGAHGIDSAAHAGALEAGGRTWAVLGCGAPILTKRKDDPGFYDRLRTGGAIVWPFPDGIHGRSYFTERNGVLVALSQMVVVVQAGTRSGTKNSATWAHELGREIWVVPGMGDAFAGSWWILDHYDSTVMRSEKDFARRLAELAAPAPALEGDALTVFRALGGTPKHPDEIAHVTGLSTSAVTTALLTLALGDVVVEGSAGLFQRKSLL
jgi:DNA processing protein